MNEVWLVTGTQTLSAMADMVELIRTLQRVSASQPISRQHSICGVALGGTSGEHRRIPSTIQGLTAKVESNPGSHEINHLGFDLDQPSPAA